MGTFRVFGSITVAIPTISATQYPVLSLSVCARMGSIAYYLPRDLYCPVPIDERVALLYVLRDFTKEHRGKRFILYDVPLPARARQEAEDHRYGFTACYRNDKGYYLSHLSANEPVDLSDLVLVARVSQRPQITFMNCTSINRPIH